MSDGLENWKPVLGWPEYEVSDLGRVRRGATMIAPFPKKGYPTFSVSRGQRTRQLRVHREVARAFLGPKYGNRGNPALSNLIWGTQRQNEADKIAHGTALRGERNHRARFSTEVIKAMREAQGTLEEIGRRFQVSISHLSRIRNNKRWSHLTP